MVVASDPLIENPMLIGGALCLDFCNTLSWRKSNSPQEWLHSYNDLLRWSRLTHALPDPFIQQLARETETHPREARRIYSKAVALRQALYSLFSAVANERALSNTDLEVLNAVLKTAYIDAEVRPNNDDFTLSFEDKPLLTQPLWVIARSAATLLTSEERQFVKECQGTGCGWLFVDTSRNHKRRWCTMAVCGNRARVKAFLQRQKDKG